MGAAVLTSLTDREQEILKLLAGALTNADIAATLYISEHTVRTHVARILAKLQLHDRAQAHRRCARDRPDPRRRFEPSPPGLEPDHGG